MLDELLDGAGVEAEKCRKERLSIAEGTLDNAETIHVINSRDTKSVVDLTSLDSVNKRIRNLKKKIKFVEELEARSDGGGDGLDTKASTPWKDGLTAEQHEKMARKDVYESELERLMLVANRLEGERRVRLQAEKSRQEAATAAIVAKRKERRCTNSRCSRNPHTYVTFTEPGVTAGMAGKGKGKAVGSRPQTMPPSFSDWGDIVTKSSTNTSSQTTPSMGTAIDPDSSAINSFKFIASRKVQSPRWDTKTESLLPAKSSAATNQANCSATKCGPRLCSRFYCRYQQ